MRLFVAITLFSISTLCYSEGIKFETKSWKEILQLAKNEKKPVFVEMYTSTCIPCKIMSKEVFTQDTVAKAYNPNIICCRYNITSKSGAIIGKKFNIRFFPTFLFVRADGTLLYKKVGALDLNSFIKMSTDALSEYNDPKTIQEWAAEYKTKGNDSEFILQYIKKLGKLGISYMSVFEQYLRLNLSKEQVSNDIAEIYSSDLEMIYVGSYAYDYLLNNRLKFKERWMNRMESLLQFYFQQTVLKAKKEKNQALFEKTMTYFDKIPWDGMPITKEYIYKFYHDKEKK